jgi:hypothetical protein
MQRATSIIDLIRQLEVPLFGTMDAEDLAAIAPLFHRRNFNLNSLPWGTATRHRSTMGFHSIALFDLALPLSKSSRVSRCSVRNSATTALVVP